MCHSRRHFSDMWVLVLAKNAFVESRTCTGSRSRWCYGAWKCPHPGVWPLCCVALHKHIHSYRGFCPRQKKNSQMIAIPSKIVPFVDVNAISYDCCGCFCWSSRARCWAGVVRPKLKAEDPWSLLQVLKYGHNKKNLIHQIHVGLEYLP